MTDRQPLRIVRSWKCLLFNHQYERSGSVVSKGVHWLRFECQRCGRQLLRDQRDLEDEPAFSRVQFTSSLVAIVLGAVAPLLGLGSILAGEDPTVPLALILLGTALAAGSLKTHVYEVENRV